MGAADKALGLKSNLTSGSTDSNIWLHVPIGYAKTMYHPTISWNFETEPEPLPGLVRMEQAGVRFPTSEDVEVPPDATPGAANALWASTDGGVSFAQQTTGWPAPVAPDPADRGWDNPRIRCFSARTAGLRDGVVIFAMSQLFFRPTCAEE